MVVLVNKSIWQGQFCIDTERLESFRELMVMLLILIWRMPKHQIKRLLILKEKNLSLEINLRMDLYNLL